MPCTTILVGKKASHDGSTMIARTDDGHYDIKKLVLVDPKKQPRKYTTVISHLTVELPDDPIPYTSNPSVDPARGVWPANGINAENVGMTATETITSNPRVLGADPLVCYQKAKKRGEKDIPGGIGEEDLVLLVLPYIRSAREGVLRLGSLLETYGTYESNGIAFNDAEEVWWLETIGGHHWMARRLRDEEVLIAPNQLGMDRFDFDDALGEGREFLCSRDLRDFVAENALDCGTDGSFNPRLVFGSRRDQDHVYNTPRAWFMARYLAPTRFRWDGPDADYTPESDNIPQTWVPERKLAVEDVKYLLSAHYQGTPYDPYSGQNNPKKGIYRSIGINRTGVMAVLQIRGGKPKALQGVEWICFGPTTFDTVLPVYTSVSKIPAYLSKVSKEPSTENFCWSSWMLAALADSSYGSCIQHIERYQEKVLSQARRLLNDYDRRMTDTGDFSLTEEANEKLCAMAKEETADTLGKVLMQAAQNMKDGYNRADN